MSLAELLSDSKSFNIAGNFDTAYRFVSVDNKIAAASGSAAGDATSAVGVVGSYRGQGNAIGGSTLSDVIPTGTIGASASASVMGAELDFKVSAILNDRRDPIELITSGFDTIPLNLEDLSIALQSETMGTLTWGYQPNVFGGVAEKCGAMPGAGTVASAHKAQFKYTLPSMLSGLEVNLAASQQNHSLDRTTELAAHAAHNLNSSVTTKVGTEASISYDLGSMLGNYGSVKIGAEILSQKADHVYGANGVTQVKIVDAANDKLSGTGYFVDADFSGVGICLNKQKTKGLGPLYQTVGGYITNAVDAAATGRRHYDHLNASLNYSIPMASYPIDLAVKYGKTERKGITSTGDQALPTENKRLGLCLGTDVSDALNFKLCYEKIDSSNGTKVGKTDVGDAKVVSFAGHYKF